MTPPISTPQLNTMSKGLNLKIEPLVSPIFARGGHLQTVLGHLLPSRHVRLESKVFHVPLADGDELVCRFVPGETSVVVALFHGLSGSIGSSYMQRTAEVARSFGHSVLFVNHRGAGEGASKAKKIYHSGVAEDISTVIRWIKANWCDLIIGREKISTRPLIYAVGFSLSANLLLNLVGRQGGSDLPDRVIAVNPPIDLQATADILYQGINYIYDQSFVRELRKIMRARVEHGVAGPGETTDFKNLAEFDRIYTAPVAGFRSPEEYYAHCSSIHYISQIKTSTVVLMAEDDPFIPIRTFHRPHWPSSVSLHIESTGGHLGYLSAKRSELGVSRWMDYFITEVFTEFQRLDQDFDRIYLRGSESRSGDLLA
jgi:uncharacterized protein